MKLRFVTIGLMVAAALMLAMWLAAQQRQDSVARMLARPGHAIPTTIASKPPPALASAPEARAYQSRLAFERNAREFLRDAPNLDDSARLARARALSREIDRREQNRELSADEAVMLRIGLIHAAVANQRERARQAQEVIDRYRDQTAARQQAFMAQQQRDAQFQAYKAQEARIVSEVLAMQSYPGGLSRDDYLRQRLQAARETIYRSPAAPPTP